MVVNVIKIFHRMNMEKNFQNARNKDYLTIKVLNIFYYISLIWSTENKIFQESIRYLFRMEFFGENIRGFFRIPFFFFFFFWLFQAWIGNWSRLLYFPLPICLYKKSYLILKYKSSTVTRLQRPTQESKGFTSKIKLLVMVVQMQQNFSKNNYIFKKKIYIIFSKTLFFLSKMFFFQIFIFVIYMLYFSKIFI